MSSRLMDESRQLSNNGESLPPTRDVVLALAASEAAAIALRSVSSNSSEATARDFGASSLANFETALDMTTKKLAPISATTPISVSTPISTTTASIDIPIWPTPTLVDMSVSSGLNMTSRCSSASVGDITADDVNSEIKEKRTKQTSNHKKSYVWRHFRHPKKTSYLSEDDSVVEEDKAKTECIHCGAILAFNQSGTTTTMLNHLKSRHGNITAVEEEKRREERLLNGIAKNKPSKNKNPIKSRKKTILQDSPNLTKIKCEPGSFFSDVKIEPTFCNDTTSMALNLTTNDRARLTASQFLHHNNNNNNNNNNNTYSSSENFSSHHHHHHHHNNNNYYNVSSGLTLNNNNPLALNNNNNNTNTNNNNNNNLATHQTGNPEIPSPVSDGQTSGRVSIGTVESCAVMVASPGSAESDSTGPRRHKKRKRTASMDSPGLLQCVGPSPSSGTASPFAGTGARSSDSDNSLPTGRLLSYIVKDLNPPEALDSENFQRLLPGMKTCSSNELRYSVMPMCIQELEQQLKSRLAAPDTTTAVAVECWDHHGALMASVGTQFLNSSGPSYRMLKTQEYCESVPLSKILSCLSAYDLTKARFLPIVSNEAQTLRDELEIFQPDGVSNTVVLPCFTTVLNDVLNDVVSYSAPLADLAPKLLEFVRPRAWQSEKWLHYYNAAMRLKVELSSKLGMESHDCALSEDDMDLLRQLAPIITQLYEALKEFNGHEPTASAVLPLVHRLMAGVLEVRDTDFKTIVTFKEGVRRGLTEHFLNNRQVHDVLALATVLDPRHKRSLLLEKDPAVRHRTLERLRDLVTDEAEDARGGSDAKRARHEPHCPHDLAPLDLGEGHSAEVALQVAAFIKAEPLPSSATNSVVMEWWRQHREEFPALARVALRYFVIPANCAPASIFSPAGPMAYRSRRALLQREDMNSLLFLHHNL